MGICLLGLRLFPSFHYRAQTVEQKSSVED